MKKIFAILVVIAMLCSFAACGAESNTAEDKSTEETTAVTDSSNDAGNSEGQKPDMNFDFENMTIGKITKISGNQVTLDLGEIDKDSMPSMPDGEAPSDMSMPDGEAPEGMSKPDGEAPSKPDGEAPEGMSKPDGEPPEGMSMPDGESPSMPDGEMPQGGGMPGFDMEINYTGETGKYTIPAEVQVGNGDYTSLSEGMVIGLTLDDNGNVTAVTIISRKGE